MSIDTYVIRKQISKRQVHPNTSKNCTHYTLTVQLYKCHTPQTLQAPAHSTHADMLLHRKCIDKHLLIGLHISNYFFYLSMFLIKKMVSTS